ncbi:unnamed protein product [Coffea canephora]|uniref:Autophagy-related protein n=2 Tax=Coffea TaxID=13442 RepID=A0A068UDP6_COFCA|nr:unnamed protein product [Coffea canephora]
MYTHRVGQARLPATAAASPLINRTPSLPPTSLLSLLSLFSGMGKIIAPKFPTTTNVDVLESLSNRSSNAKQDARPHGSNNIYAIKTSPIFSLRGQFCNYSFDQTTKPPSGSLEFFQAFRIAVSETLEVALIYRRFVIMAKSSFKLEHPLERRQAEAARIREKYPDRIPVIVEKAEKSDIPDIDKKKYLVPADLTVGQFVYVVRKRIKLSAEKAIFIFVKNILPPTAAMMSAIYEENKDEDGFLYMTYSGENTFGSR